MISHESQERIVSYLLKNESVALKALEVLNSGHFTDSSLHNIFSAFYALLNKHKKLPTQRELQAVLDRLNLPKGTIVINQDREVLTNLYSLDTTGATYAELVEYATKRETEALLKNIVELKNPTDILTIMDKSKNKLNPLLISSGNETLTMPFADEVITELTLYNDVANTISTGFDCIDGTINHGGLYRGEVGMTLGATGKGKSMVLINQAINLFSKGYKIIYITLDNPQQEILSRIYANITDTSMADMVELSDRKKAVDKWLDENEVDIKHFHIKALPTYTPMNEIKAHIERAKDAMDGVDVVFLDYLDLITSSVSAKSNEERIRLTHLANEAREIAQTYQAVVYTVSQVNREGAKQNNVKGVHVSEAWAKLHPVSLVLTLSQAPEEAVKKPEQFRFFIDKNTKGTVGLMLPMFIDKTKAKIWDNVEVKPYIEYQDNEGHTHRSEQERGTFRRGRPVKARKKDYEKPWDADSL